MKNLMLLLLIILLGGCAAFSHMDTADVHDDKWIYPNFIPNID